MLLLKPGNMKRIVRFSFTNILDKRKAEYLRYLKELAVEI